MMTPECIKEQFSDEAARIFNQERFKEEVSQAIFSLMEYDDARQSDLAERLNCSRANVSKMLGGSHNFTLETLADVFMALGRSAHILLDLNMYGATDATDQVSEWAHATNGSWSTLSHELIRHAPKHAFRADYESAAESTTSLEDIIPMRAS